MFFKIMDISHGWFDVDFNRQFVLTNSDYLGCDAPALLLQALSDLIEQESVVQWLCWQDEPGAYILKLERYDNRLIGEIYDTDADSSNLEYRGDRLARYAKACVYRFEEEMDKAVKSVLQEFALYETGNGKHRYQNHWGDFPQKEYERLKKTLQLPTVWR